MTEHRSTSWGGGGGLFYFKLMNKTLWQELFLQISGALVVASCQDHAKFIMFITLPRPNPEGTGEVLY